MSQNCGTCRYSVLSPREGLPRYRSGLCNYPLLPVITYRLPDSVRIDKLPINGDDGQNCPCYEQEPTDAA